MWLHTSKVAADVVVFFLGGGGGSHLPDGHPLHWRIDLCPCPLSAVQSRSEVVYPRPDSLSILHLSHGFLSWLYSTCRFVFSALTIVGYGFFVGRISRNALFGRVLNPISVVSFRHERTGNHFVYVGKIFQGYLKLSLKTNPQWLWIRKRGCTFTRSSSSVSVQARAKFSSHINVPKGIVYSSGRAGSLRLLGKTLTTALLHDQNWTIPFGLIVPSQGRDLLPLTFHLNLVVILIACCFRLREVRILWRASFHFFLQLVEIIHVSCDSLNP